MSSSSVCVITPDYAPHQPNLAVPHITIVSHHQPALCLCPARVPTTVIPNGVCGVRNLSVVFLFSVNSAWVSLGFPCLRRQPNVLEGAPSFARLRREGWVLTIQRHNVSSLLWPLVPGTESVPGSRVSLTSAYSAPLRYLFLLFGS